MSIYFNDLLRKYVRDRKLLLRNIVNENNESLSSPPIVSICLWKYMDERKRYRKRKLVGTVSKWVGADSPTIENERIRRKSRRKEQLSVLGVPTSLLHDG